MSWGSIDLLTCAKEKWFSPSALRSCCSALSSARSLSNVYGWASRRSVNVFAKFWLSLCILVFCWYCNKWPQTCGLQQHKFIILWFRKDRWPTWDPTRDKTNIVNRLTCLSGDSGGELIHFLASSHIFQRLPTFCLASDLFFHFQSKKHCISLSILHMFSSLWLSSSSYSSSHNRPVNQEMSC